MVGLMKKEKIYEFNSLGLAQAQLDCRLFKQNRLNRILTSVLILGLGVAGVISISLMLISLSGTFIGVISEHIIK